MRVAYLVAGCLCAAAAGIGYLGFLWGAAWAGFGFIRIGSLAAGAIAVIVALTLLFVPAELGYSHCAFQARFSLSASLR